MTRSLSFQGSEYLGAIIDGRTDRVGTLARAVNDIHLSVEHCNRYHVAILSAETLKTLNCKG
ncbi:MAG: hypothetical protein WBC36_15160 [Desulfobacterales bacterium]